MFRIFLSLLLTFWWVSAPSAQDWNTILQTHQAEVAKPSRRTVGVLLDDLVASGLPGVSTFLEQWRDKAVYVRPSDGKFFYRSEDALTLLDIATGAEVGPVDEGDLKQIRPNGGVRRAIGTALVQFQLSDPDPERRRAALASIARDMKADQLAPLRASIAGETDQDLRAQKERLVQMITALFAAQPQERIAAISQFAGDISVDARAVLNQIVATRTGFAPARSPETLAEHNIARVLAVGEDISLREAYAILVDAGEAAPVTSAQQVKDALAENVRQGRVAGFALISLADEETRMAAYRALAAQGDVPPLIGAEVVTSAVAEFTFFEAYLEANPAITSAAEESLVAIQASLVANQTLDLGLDALSLASIYFLAAIGLAITFGVMGVINMAHGEFIMMGAYTGYVIQQIIPDYTLSLVIALPVAFAITFGAGVGMERLVIRRLYHRPLETLLATFGISIALQQLAKNIFGTQARPLTAPSWLDGAWIINDVVSISYIRIAIFFLALIFLGLMLYILKRTRLGLEVRAVTQNPQMASSMGINREKINMLTFGLGSGIAGIAGVAIGLYAKVTSEMGADYIVQSFMTVVVGGGGTVGGTLVGAGLIGGLQKMIEWMNPSNTLAAQTYMILFIILFIQFRPKGIIALKGRAAGE